MKKSTMLVGVLALVVMLSLTVVGAAFAQSSTPPTQQTPTNPKSDFGLRGFRMGGWGTEFDTVAKALNLTPTQLFEQLHSGKTLTEIAAAQGVDLQKVQDALQADRAQAQRDAIAQAVKDGKITQEQADWLLQGLDKGYLPGGRGGFFGHGGRGGMRGFGMKDATPNGAVAPGTSG
jgi:hypothetical protein